MLMQSTILCVEEQMPTDRDVVTIHCYLYPLVTSAAPIYLRPDQRLAFEAMKFLLRLDHEMRETRADWNEDRFRRLMRLRPKAVRRLERRWVNLEFRPRIPLGSLRRRYHPNLSCYLYEFNP